MVAVAFETLIPKSRETVLPSGCVHELFDRQVERVPDATAVSFEDQELTYTQLNARANQLAQYLRQLGVGPESLVGICLDRSLDMIVAVLGIMKAGAAYVPLDPNYPRQRLLFMLEDAQVDVLVTRERWKTLGDHQTNIICMDSDRAAIQLLSDQPPLTGVTGANTAYVIYTSGSTGKPKGVVLTHHALMNYLNWCMSEYGLDEGCGSVVHSSLSFDLTVTSLFGPLIVGQTVYLTAEAEGLAALSRGLTNGKYYSVLKITPAHLRILSELLPANLNPLPVGALVVGGEALQYEQLSFWRQPGSNVRIINEYGPTEAAVGCSTYEIFPLDPISGAVPIGEPIPHTQLYILDADSRPTPLGEIGELYIGGECLARGYLHRPELTAERFVPNAFSIVPGSRLYRTGDLVRKLPDGNHEFVCRVDNQIKLSGYRIELGEIETALAQHSLIKECAVDVRANASGEKTIVGYIVSVLGYSVNHAELRAFLRRQIPDYMIPSRFIDLAALPLTTNGKIDRQQLQALGDEDSKRALPVGPMNALETELTQIWEEVLELSDVGVTDDFFELGGTSIAAIRLVSQMSKRLGRKLGPAVLFQASTIEALAQLLFREDVSKFESSLVPIQPQGDKPPLFCIHACGGHVFIYRTLVRHLGMEQPVYGLRAAGFNGEQELHTSVPEMAEQYIREIKKQTPHGPYYILGDTLGGLIALQIAIQLKSQGEEVAFLGMLDTYCPFTESENRVLSHLRHLRQLGPREYVQAATLSLRRKLIKRGSIEPTELPLTSDEQKFAARMLGTNDPIGRIEWAIYLATHVNYRLPKGRYPGRLTYFLARDNQIAESGEDNRLHWTRLAEEFEAHVIPGRHDTMREEPHVAALAEAIKTCLARGQSVSPAKPEVSSRHFWKNSRIWLSSSRYRSQTQLKD